MLRGCYSHGCVHWPIPPHGNRCWCAHWLARVHLTHASSVLVGKQGVTLHTPVGADTPSHPPASTIHPNMPRQAPHGSNPHSCSTAHPPLDAIAGRCRQVGRTCVQASPPAPMCCTLSAPPRCQPVASQVCCCVAQAGAGTALAAQAALQAALRYCDCFWEVWAPPSAHSPAHPPTHSSTHQPIQDTKGAA